MVVLKDPGSQLNFDPGPSRRKSSSGCKCILWTIAFIFLSFVGILIGNMLFTTWKGLHHLHRNLYANITLTEVESTSTIIQPLIDDNQTFDIAATVWVRKTGYELGWKNLVLFPEIYPGQILFSDIVFRGLRLKDKHRNAKVEIQVPVEIFKEKFLTNYDLRGSLILIPNSPSLLNSLHGHSSWVPPSVKMPPVRAWPFPLGSDNDKPRGIEDDAIDSFGINIPLVEFHNIQSQCNSGNDMTTTDEPHGLPTSLSQHLRPDDRDFEDDEDMDEETAKEFSATKKSNPNPNKRHRPSATFFVTDGSDPLDQHPYIVTRTQLRVADFTELYNRKLYNLAHQQLKRTSCGQDRQNMRPNWTLCKRNFVHNGNLETRLNLKMMNKTTGNMHTEWAYAPYMSALQNGHGPLDLISVPVNREDCSAIQNLRGPQPSSHNDREYMNITWRISYTGRSPMKLVLGESSKFSLGNFRPQNMSDLEDNLKVSQNTMEMLNGLRGHRFHEDAHPRRVLLFVIIHDICRLLLLLFQINYWYTRSSTVGLSIHGTSLIAGMVFTSFFLGIILDMKEKGQETVEKLISCLTTTTFWLPMLLSMIKAVGRIDIQCYKGWIPIFRSAPPTHKERASQRLDEQLDWRFKSTVLLSVMAFFLLVADPDRLFLIKPSVTFPRHGVQTKLETLCRKLIICPFWLVGNLLQIRMNAVSKSFAGTYKLCLLVEVIIHLIAIAMHATIAVGRTEVDRGISLNQLLQILVVSAKTWQAMTLPAVPHSEEDHDIE